MKDFLHHLLFPRESNNYRSKLLHHDSLFIVILLLLLGLFSLSSIHNSFPQVLGISSTISPEDLLKLTNQERLAHGLSPLRIDSELAQAASEKAADMFAKNYWAHVAPDGVTPWVFIKNSGYEYLYAGENLARGFTSTGDVVNAWMASPSHRENILSPNYQDVGFAVASGSLTGSDTILVVEEFGSRYIAQTPDINTSKENVVITYPSPTEGLVVGKINQSSTPTLVPTMFLQNSSAVAQAGNQLPNSQQAVAALQSQPFINKKNLSQDVAIGIIVLLLSLLIIDALVIERKKVTRLIGHNIDHIIYLVIILIVVIILGKGLIL